MKFSCEMIQFKEVACNNAMTREGNSREKERGVVGNIILTVNPLIKNWGTRTTTQDGGGACEES